MWQLYDVNGGSCSSSVLIVSSSHYLQVQSCSSVYLFTVYITCLYTNIKSMLNIFTYVIIKCIIVLVDITLKIAQ